MSTVSSLSRIDTLRRHLSANPADKEAWLQLEATLRRSGQDPSEVFEPLHALAMQARNEATAKRQRMEGKRQAYVDGLYRHKRLKLPRPMVCARCNGRTMCEVPRHMQRWGDGDDWRMNEPYRCPACHPERTRQGPFPVKLHHDPKLRDECHKAAIALYRPFLGPLIKAEDQAQAELDKFSAALAVTSGARVRYTNKRARAKFARGGQLEGTKVPHGTEGEVFWTGRNYSDWIPKLGIRTDSGDVFFTSARHCSDQALNAYARWRGVDAATLREKDKARKALKDADKVREVFGEAGPKRGQRVRLRGFEGKIAWVGACRKSNRTRVGVKRLLSERDMGAWGYASECEVIQ